MATGRVYRDYSKDSETFEVQPRRHGSLRNSASPTQSSPRTIVPYNKSDDYRPHPQVDFHPGYGAGFASTTPDDTDEEFRSSYEHARSEPILYEDQFDVDPQNNTALAVPANIQKKRGFSAQVTQLSNGSSAGFSTEGSSTMSKMPEFFGHAIFQVVLHNPTIAHQLLKFSETRMCDEYIEFLARVSKYHTLLNEVSKGISEMHKDFISPNAARHISMNPNLSAKVNNDIKTSLTSTLPRLESVFVNIQSDVERTVFTDIYPKFVRHQMSVSAAKALGSDRSRYTGLGDCFVLTDPSKADNPIVFVSDGFAKVTGYSRKEIVPRNCRFLQNGHTDRAAVRRLKAAIERREECVELLLNERKDGEPFWNLLYVAPLFDGYGNLVFFIGGQINCSTTIHSTSDILRILSQSTNAEESEPSRAQSPQAVRQPKRGLLSAFRSNSRTNIQQGAPGMENNLLGKLENMPLKNQVRSFYTAYSNYVVINYTSWLVSFVSSGIVELLFPVKATKTAYHSQAVGTDIFKFLGNHSSGSVSWDFKSSVKSALKAGNPISLDLKLCAKPYMGFERFATHWTPLKDEVGTVSWVVLTLGNEQRA